MNLTKLLRKDFEQHAGDNVRLTSARLIESDEGSHILYRVRVIWDGLEDEAIDLACPVSVDASPIGLRQHAIETATWFGGEPACA